MIGKTNLKLLFLVVVFFQVLSLTYSLFTGYLTGDYISYEFKFSHNLFWASIFTILPFFLLKVGLEKTDYKNNNKYTAIDENNLFKYVALFLLLLNIFFSFFFNVGKAATDIYEAPLILKPIIVLVNRLNINIIVAYLLLSDNIGKGFKFLLLLGIVILALSKASIAVFLLLFLLFLIRTKKDKKSSNSVLKSFFSLFFLSIIVIAAPIMYQFRDSYRYGEIDLNYIEILERTNYFDFIFGKVIGRISNISSYVFFIENLNIMESSVNKLDYYSFFLEFLKPIWGSFVDYRFNSYTYYLTNLFDYNAGYDYGIMYGLPIVLILSYLSLPILPIFIIVFLTSIIILTIKISKRLFGHKYKDFIFILLFFPITSGVAPEFLQITIDLLLLYLLKILLYSINRNKTSLN